jgi:hypothetical protein
MMTQKWLPEMGSNAQKRKGLFITIAIYLSVNSTTVLIASEFVHLEHEDFSIAWADLAMASWVRLIFGHQ